VPQHKGISGYQSERLVIGAELPRKILTNRITVYDDQYHPFAQELP